MTKQIVIDAPEYPDEAGRDKLSLCIERMQHDISAVEAKLLEMNAKLEAYEEAARLRPAPTYRSTEHQFSARHNGPSKRPSGFINAEDLMK